MTRILVRVVDAREAAQAAAASVDLIEFNLPDAQPDCSEAKAVRAVFPGQLRLRVAVSGAIADIIQDAVNANAQELALQSSSVFPPSSVARALAAEGLKLVAEISVSEDASKALERVIGRTHAVMFTAGRGTRILDIADVAQLDVLASTCRENGVPFGFAGGLEPPDVARLLLLEPDVLAFDSAVRVGHQATAPLDPLALDAIRALLPQGVPIAKIEHSAVRDRLFVRNLVLPLSIGAYQAEHGARQRVRFGVEVEIVREPAPPRDMRDVFSYDVIIETIRVLAGRAHVVFVETLAEEISTALLVHPAVMSVIVSVAKLDIIDGEVGIEIHRRRSL